MDKIFEVGARVKGKPGTLYELWIGLIEAPSLLYDERGRQVPWPDGSQRWGVLWKEKRRVPMTREEIGIVLEIVEMREEDIEIIE